MAELSRPDSAKSASALEWRVFRWQFAAVVVVLATILGGGAFLRQRLDQSTGALIASTARARMQVNAVNAVLDTLQDAETGQRGFLLTLKPAYLEPYDAALKRIEPALDSLSALGRESYWLAERARELRSVALQKADELRHTVELAQAGDVAGALAVVVTDRGKALMDDVRARVAAIAQHAEAERARTARQLQISQSTTVGATQVALVTGLLLFGFALVAALWQRARTTATQRAERRADVQFRAAISHLRDGIAVFDGSDRLQLCNRRFAPLLGLDADLVRPGLSWAAMVAAQAEPSPALHSASPPAQPAVVEAKRGRRILELWRSAMPEGGQMLAVADITRRVQAEEVARQAQKMEVLGQMTGGVAHDFNNLLQVVSANLELVTNRLARGTIDPWVQTRLEAARAGVTRGARLTRHLLAFARRQPLAPEALDPARVLTGMEDTFRRTLGGSIELELVIGGGLWTVRADPNQLENALLNLALNARDAMAASGGAPAKLDAEYRGRLTIEAANASLDDAYAAQQAEVSPGQYVMFAVTDTGIGMTPEQLARATEPFFTTKPDGQGTGLGLSMVFGFAKQSGGHFQLYSEPGQGTTARLYIPRTTSAARPATDALPAPAVGRGELVLVVEDDPPVRQAAADALRGLGYAVIEAANADAALAMLEQGARPHLLFTDVVMPGQITSRTLAERAQAMLPGLAVLFTSGYTQNAIVHNGQLDPGISLISKPWRTEDLARQVRAVLDQAAVR